MSAKLSLTDTVPVVENALQVFNKVLTKQGYRFVLFLENVRGITGSVTADDEDEDAPVAPDREVAAYSSDRMALYREIDDDSQEAMMVYTSQSGPLQAGNLIGSVIAADELMFDTVNYAFQCAKIDAAAYAVISHSLDADSDDADEVDIEDLDDLDGDDH
jgi:hypothetical protein